MPPSEEEELHPKSLGELRNKEDPLLLRTNAPNKKDLVYPFVYTASVPRKKVNVWNLFWPFTTFFCLCLPSLLFTRPHDGCCLYFYSFSDIEKKYSKSICEKQIKIT
jgi:hypothetical protein